MKQINKKNKIRLFSLATVIISMVIISSCEDNILPETGSIADATPPSALFSASQGTGPDLEWKMYSFSNQSASATIYSWTFGDGNTSTEFEPTNTYPGEGTFTVTLNARDALGVESSYSQEITVVEPPAPAAITPEILNGDFTDGQDNWKVSSFTGGTTSPYNSSSDGSWLNYDGSDNGSKTAGAKWTSSTSGGPWASSSSRYAYQAITVTPNTDYFLEYEYAIKDDAATDPPGGRRIVGEILDGHFSDGADALASSNAGALGSHVGTEALGKTVFTLVKERFTSNATGEVSIWINGVTPVDAYVDNVKVYPAD